MTHARIPAILFLVGLAGCGHWGTSPPEEAEGEGSKAVVTVRAEAARRGPMVEAVEALGRIEALPDHLATLTPAVEGHVHKLLVKHGDTVKKGQPIVELDQSVALADRAEKTATRDSLKASLALLKSLPRTDEQKPMILAIETAKVALEKATRAAGELKKLQANHLASEQQILDAENTVAAARIALETAEAQHHMQIIGPRPEAVAEAEAKIKTADGAVAFSQAHLDLHTIRAPIDGVLDSLNCHPGQTISIGTPIGEIVDSRQVYASVWLPTRAAQGIRLGQAASIRPSAESTDNEKAPTGKVEFVGRIADPQTGNIPVHILVENSQGIIAVGQTIAVTINREEQKDVLQVPVAAILDLGEGPVIQVIRDGKSATLHPQVGITRDGWIAVSGTDLKDGEPVIVEGGYGVPDKTTVKLVTEEAQEGEGHAKAANKDDKHEDNKPKDEKREGEKTKVTEGGR